MIITKNYFKKIVSKPTQWLFGWALERVSSAFQGLHLNWAFGLDGGKLGHQSCIILKILHLSIIIAFLNSKPSILSLASVTRSSLSFRFSLLSQRPNRRLRREEREMGGLTSAVIAIAGVVLGWITIEIACKPCLEQGRQAIDRSLNPDYDPDDDQNVDIRAPLNPSSSLPQDSDPNAHTVSSAPKVITIS